MSGWHGRSSVRRWFPKANTKTSVLMEWKWRRRVVGCLALSIGNNIPTYIELVVAQPALYPWKGKKPCVYCWVLIVIFELFIGGRRVRGPFVQSNETLILMCLLSLSSFSGREDLLLSRRHESRPEINGADPPDNEAHRRAWPRPAVRSVVVRSGQGHERMGWKRSWSQFHFRRGGELTPPIKS